MGRLIRFSANLGFLWADRPLPVAIRSAARAGFAAIECHWPYDTPVEDMRAALAETGLEMLGLNTCRGNVAAGDFGLAALPDRVGAARASIDRALDYAAAAGAEAVHVMAGNAAGDAAHRTFADNLAYACDKDPARTILIEPMNQDDAPAYFLRTTAQAAELIAEIGAANLKLMFDCYHVARTEGDVIPRLRELIGIVGHIQFAGVPDRGPPDQGDLAYEPVFDALADLGWDRPLGAEYRPGGDTDRTLGWLTRLIK